MDETPEGTIPACKTNRRKNPQRKPPGILDERPLNVRLLDIITLDLRPVDLRHLDVIPTYVRPLDVRPA